MGIFRKMQKARPEKKRCVAVIVAAGSAVRMQGIDKSMADLNGQPVILRTLRAFENCDCIHEIVVVTRGDLIEPIQSLCQKAGIAKVQAVICGGTERRDSVLAGLDWAANRAELAAIHDGARPLVPVDVIQEAVTVALRTGAAAPAIPVKDTIKVAKDRVILATPDRNSLQAVQTPQVFDLDLIRGALYKAVKDNIPVTDDCAAVERLGMKIHLTTGSEENIKITTPLDLTLVKAILDRRESRS